MDGNLVAIVGAVSDTEGDEAHEKDAKNDSGIQAAGVIEDFVRLAQGEGTQ